MWRQSIVNKAERKPHLLWQPPFGATSAGAIFNAPPIRGRTMSIARIIGKIYRSEQQLTDLTHLGISYIATDNTKSRSDEDEIIKRIGEAEAIIINISIHITKNIIRQCRKLRFIQTWSTDIDNIDIEAANKEEIIVKNVPDFSVEAVAEKKWP